MDRRSCRFRNTRQEGELKLCPDSWTDLFDDVEVDIDGGGDRPDDRSVDLRASAPTLRLIGQAPEWCVPASFKMALDHLGVDVSVERCAEALGQKPGVRLPDEELGRLAAAALDVSGGRFEARRLKDTTWDAVTAQLDRGRPVLSFLSNHARLIVGYRSASRTSGDVKRGYIVFDPAYRDEGCVRQWEHVHQFQKLAAWVLVSRGSPVEEATTRA